MSMANIKRRKSAKRRLGGPYERVLALIAVILCKGASCAVGSEAAAAEASSVPPNDARSMTLDITPGRQRTRPAITIHSLPERYKGAGHKKRRHRQIEVGPETTITSRSYVSTYTGDEPVFDVMRSLQSKSTQEEQITHSVQTTFDGANGSHGTMLDVISRGTTVDNDDPAIISITSLHIHVNLPSAQQPNVNTSPVLVYTRLGTHRGYEAKPSEWTLIFNSTVETAGFAKPTWLPTALFGSCGGCAPKETLWGPSTSASSSPDASSSSSLSLVPGHLEIPPGHTRAFYIHLPGKDLRYSNSNPDPNAVENGPSDVLTSPEGDAIVAHDDQILIAEGTGVGGYWGIGPTPGEATELYSPRIWNGVVNYVVGPFDESKAGPAVSQDILNQYSNTVSGSGTTSLLPGGPSTTIEDTEICPRQADTVLQDNMGSFGNMFDVLITAPPGVPQKTVIRITGLEIYVDLEKEVTYELRYRRGPFSKAMEPLAVDTKWTLIAEGTVTGAGRGVATLIPPDSWLNQIVVPVGGTDHPDATVLGFYITLTSPDIRYSKLGGGNTTTPIASANGAPSHSSSRTDAESAPSPLVGDIFSTSEDGLISIAIGVGVAEYPLGTTFYGPRLFNGRLLYDVLSESVPCPTPAPTTAAPTRARFGQTEVVYEFIVQRPPEITEWDLYRLLDDSVTETVEGLLSGVSDDLTALTTKYSLALEEVVSVTSFGANVEDDCTLADPKYVCVAVNSYVTLQHTPNVDPDIIVAGMLKHTDEVVEGVGLYSNYVGEEAADAEVIVTLAGVDREMDDNEIQHYEESTKDFLNSAFESGEGGQYNEDGEPVRVLEVKVEDQYLISGTGRHLQSSSSSSTSLGITTSITAECRRCRDEFDAGKVDDAFESNPEEFKEELQKPRVMIDEETGEQTTGSPPAYFEKVEDITSVAVTPAPTPPPPGGSKAGMSTGTIIIIVASVLGVGGLMFSLLIVRRKKNSQAGHNDIAANLHYGGDYDLDPYAGGGFVGQGSSHNNQKFLLRASSYNNNRSGSDRSIGSAKRKHKAMAQEDAAAGRGHHLAAAATAAAAQKAEAFHADQMQRMSSSRTAATDIMESSRSFGSAQWSGGQHGSGRPVRGSSPGRQQRGRSPSPGRQSSYNQVVGRVSVMELEAEALASASASASRSTGTISMGRLYVDGGSAAAAAAPYGRGSRSERHLPAGRGGNGEETRFDERRSRSERILPGGVMR